MTVLRYLLLLHLAIYISGCTDDFNRERITKCEWKYGDGFHLKDILTFDKADCYLTNGGDILRHGKIIGKIKSYDSGSFYSVQKLEIISTTGEVGYYVELGCKD